MYQVLKRFSADESGTTAIEYAIIGSGVFLAIVSTLTSIGTKLGTTFSEIETGLP